MEPKINRRSRTCDAESVSHCRYVDEVSREAATNAVRDVFDKLGVDVDDPRSLEEFRDGLRFGQKLNKRADYAVLAIIGVIAVGVAAALWQGIIVKIKGG